MSAKLDEAYLFKRGNLLSKQPNQSLSSAAVQPNWIPDFSRPIVLLRALLVAVGIAILLALLRYGLSGLDMSALGPLALLSVWICCLSALGLQLLRVFTGCLPLWISASIALFWMLLMAGVCGMAPYWLGLSSSLIGDGEPISMAIETILITLMVGGAALRGFYVHFETQEQQRRLLQAKYDALQARIRPHFLFNSLNTVAELIAVDVVRAENAVLDLSDLFRASLSDQGAVAVSHEVSLCEKYLGIEQLRMAERLRWQFDVEDAAASWLIPALCLQPIIENAVIHGLQPIREGGLISMTVSVIDDHLVIQVTNPISNAPQSSARGTGTALENIRARLEVFCGPPVIFQAQELAESYQVEIRMPSERRH